MGRGFGRWSKDCARIGAISDPGFAVKARHCIGIVFRQVDLALIVFT